MTYKLPDTMTLRPYVPSRSPEALLRLPKPIPPGIRNNPDLDDLMAQAAQVWIAALGSAPECADECITPFVLLKGTCSTCYKQRRVTIVLDGFKGMVDGNLLLCEECITDIL